MKRSVFLIFLISFSTLGFSDQISTGATHTCLLSSGKVKCWGWNQYEQTDVPALKNPKRISAKGSRSCALDDDGVIEKNRLIICSRIIFQH